MKLQLKRSNVIESGAAKLPTSAQLEYGELAINYNQEDPAIFLKDSNNNVIRISGIGNIADDGQVELPASTTPPANPLSGNLWFNSEDGRLYIYYTDPDSSQWIDASPDSWDPSSYPDVTDPTEQPNTLDDRYVSKVATTSQDMAGDLTLGTDKITLDATDGSITATTNVTLGSPGTSNPSDSGIGLFRGVGGHAGAVWLKANSSGTPATDKALNVVRQDGTYSCEIRHDGNIYAANAVEVGANPAAPNITLNGNGSAMFSDIIYSKSDIRVQATGDQIGTTTTKAGITLYQYGAIHAAGASASSPVFKGLLNDGNSATSQILADGSAEFAGNILANKGVGVDGGASLSTGLYYRDDSESYGIALYSGGSAQTNRKVFITTDGSAKFAGSISSDTGGFYRTGESGIVFSGNAIIPTDGNGAPNNTLNDFGANTLQFKDGYFYGNVTTGSITASARESSTFADGAIQLNSDGSGAFGDGTIVLRADGKAEFDGQIRNYNLAGIYSSGRMIAGYDVQLNSPQAYGITATNNLATTDADGQINNASAVWGRNLNAAGRVWCGISGTSTITSEILADGSAEFASDVQVGLKVGAGVNPGVYLYHEGQVIAARSIASNSVFTGFTAGNSTVTSEITANGNATFTGTVTANGSVLTRASGNLDVGDRLEKADVALKALKVAAAASTDFASLKSAIATALANI